MDIYDTKALKRLQSKLAPQENGCLLFTGDGSEPKFYPHRKGTQSGTTPNKPRILYKGSQIAPQRVAWGLASGVDPRQVKLISIPTCGNPLCCKLEHIHAHGVEKTLVEVTLPLARRIHAALQANPNLTQVELDDVVAGRTPEEVEIDPDADIMSLLRDLGPDHGQDLETISMMAGRPVTQDHLERFANGLV
jgi:hypothetical protein